MRAVLLSLLILPGLAGAEIYRWTDAKGQVHYSEQPAVGAEKVEVKPQVMQRDEATRATEERSQRFYQARQQERTEAAAANSKSQAERAQECSKLRSSLAELEQGGKFYKTDANGELNYYSDEQIEGAKANLRSRLSSRCG